MDENSTIEDISEGNPLVYAALVLLRKELAKVAEIRLTKLDFDTWADSLADGVNFKLDMESGDIILTHVASKNDA